MIVRAKRRLDLINCLFFFILQANLSGEDNVLRAKVHFAPASSSDAADTQCRKGKARGVIVLSQKCSHPHGTNFAFQGESE